MGIGAQMKDIAGGFTARLSAKNKRIFVGVAAEIQRSVQSGSEITGAKGQPVDKNVLRPSFIPEFIDDVTWQTSTNLPYARPIEDGVGPYGALTLRSKVGGFHSVKLTKAGYGRIVAHVVSEDQKR